MHRLSLDDDQPPIPKGPPPFSLMGWLSPLWTVPTAITVLLALFGPLDVLDRLPVARQFTLGMLEQFPQIDRQANSTAYPQVALLVNCLVIALIPLCSLYMILATIFNYPVVLERVRRLIQPTLAWHLGAVLTVPVFLFALYVHIMFAGDPSLWRGFTTNSRVGFAMITFLLLWFTSGSIGAQILNLRLFVDLQLKKGN